MKASVLRSHASLAMLAVVTVLAGCRDLYPKPSEDAIYYFVADARLGGKMRVCWPAGQAYAVSITKASAELQNELNKIRDLMSYEAEWPKDAPRWHDAKAVQQQLEMLTRLADDGADARRKKLRGLGEAIDKLPEGLTFSDENAKDAFKQRLWEALAVGLGDITYLESILEMRLRLFEKVHEYAGSLDASAAGLRFTDASQQREVDALYDAFTQRVAAERERFLDLAAERMPQILAAIEKIDKQKQREEYTLLDNERSYFRKRIEGTQRELRALIKGEAEKLAECEESDTPQPSRIAFHKHRIERLKSELANLVECAKSILKP